eukprot:115116_1
MSSQSLREKAKMYLKQNRWSDAKQALMKLLAINPSNDVILTKIGKVHEELNDFNKSRSYYEKAIEMNPQNMHALRHLGQLYQYQFDDLSKAEQYYIKCININPNYDFIHFHLGKLYTKQQQFNKARSSFGRCDYNLAAVNYHYGKYLLAINDYQTALHHFQSATNIKPQVANYHFEYGKTVIKLTRGYVDGDSRARNAFIKALELSKYKEPKIIFEYALYLIYKFDPHYNKRQNGTYLYNFKALNYINLALELDPKNVTYKYIQLTEQ